MTLMIAEKGVLMPPGQFMNTERPVVVFLSHHFFDGPTAYIFDSTDFLKSTAP